MDTGNGLYNIYELILNWFEHFDEICASYPLKTYINGNERQPNGNKDNNDNPRTKTIAERKDGQIRVIVGVHLRKVDFFFKFSQINDNYDPLQLLPSPWSPSSLSPLVHQPLVPFRLNGKEK